MSKIYEQIDDGLKAFLREQKLFFVSTAPAGAEGRINLSPKGLDTLRILGPRTVAYLDFTGSGIETVAHLRENGRIVLMLCAFEGSPRIVRLHGRGTVVEPQDDAFSGLLAHFTKAPGVRSIIQVDIERISDSCGYGVPLYRYEGERTQLAAWADRKGEDGLAEYRAKNNAASIDGLPGLGPQMALRSTADWNGAAIEFDKLQWESPAPGCRFKAFRRDGKQLRLVEFTPEFVELEWCEKGHIGIVLSGELEIDFRERMVRFEEGAAIYIPPGHGHKARHLSPLVRLFLVEDI